MNSFFAVALLLVCSGFVFGFVRGARRTADANRREQEQKAWERKQDERRQGDIMKRALRYFPFLDESVIASRPHIADPLDGLRTALTTVPGVVIGAGPMGLPIPLPLSVRTRHAVVFGRTGTGKTSFALRIIDDDLRNGRNLVIIGGERELFRDHVLPRIPLSRARETVYFSVDTECPVTWNPMQLEPRETRDVSALELFHAVRQALDEPSIGGRSDAIARNVFQALVGFPNASFLSIRPLLQDGSFRKRVLAYGIDPQCRLFWEQVFPKFPTSAILPFLVRTDQFTGSPLVRKALCQPKSSFSLSQVLNQGILLADLSGLDPDSFRLAAQLLLARVQVALLRRNSIPESERPFTSIVLDEFHLFATAASEYTFRQLASRSRRMGAGLLLLTQHGGQLPRPVCEEVLGNASTIISFAVGAKDAAAIRRELPVPSPDDGAPVPVSAEALVSLPVGSGYARIGSGALALPVKFKAPLEPMRASASETIKEISWKMFGCVPPASSLDAEDLSVEASDASDPALPGEFLCDSELRFLRIILGSPQRPSGEYAKLAGLNGTRAARLRKSLVTRGYLREHKLARSAHGKPAVILEPLESALKAVAGSEEERA